MEDGHLTFNQQQKSKDQNRTIPDIKYKTD